MIQAKSRCQRTIVPLYSAYDNPPSGTRPHPQHNLSPVLTSVAWAVVGAATTRLYMPERATQDLDIAIAVHDREKAYADLQQSGFQRVGKLSIGGSSWRTPEGEIVDVIEGSEEWWPQALAAVQSNRDSQGLPVLPFAFLVLMKFQAGRTRDLGDITQMLGLADDEALDAVRQLFSRYAPKDQADLESLILLGKMEME